MIRHFLKFTAACAVAGTVLLAPASTNATEGLTLWRIIYRHQEEAIMNDNDFYRQNDPHGYYSPADFNRCGVPLIYYKTPLKFGDGHHHHCAGPGGYYAPSAPPSCALPECGAPRIATCGVPQAVSCAGPHCGCATIATCAEPRPAGYLPPYQPEVFPRHQPEVLLRHQPEVSPDHSPVIEPAKPMLQPLVPENLPAQPAQPEVIPDPAF